MNTNILAISNIFVGTENVGPYSTTPKEVKQSNEFSSPPLESKPLEYSRGIETAENHQFQNKTDNETPIELRNTLRGQTLSQKQIKAKNNKDPKTQIQDTDTDIQPTLIQLRAAQYIQNAKQTSEATANKTELKTGYENARLQINIGPQDSLLLAGATTDQIEHLKAISQTQNGPMGNALQIPKRPLITELPSNQGGTENQIQNPNTRLRAIRGSYEEQKGDGLNLQAVVQSQQKSGSGNGKLEVLPLPDAPDNPKIPQLAREQLASETPVNTNNAINRIGQNQDITNKPDTTNQQTQEKPSALQPEPFRNGLENSHPIPENAIENKTEAGQPDRIRTQQFWGPPADDISEQGYNSPGPFAYQHLHRAQHQMSTGPTKGRDDSGTNNNSDPGFAQMLSTENSPTYIMEQTSAFSEMAKNENLPPQTPLSDIAESITQKMMETLQSSPPQEAGTHQITLRLNPPELGMVRIKFEEQENQISGLLQVSKAQTRYEVERTLPSIVQNLVDSGIQVKRLEVMLTNQEQQQSFNNELLQDGLFQQHHFSPEDNDPNNYSDIGPSQSGLYESETGYQDSPQPQLQLSANSINVLI